MVHRVRSTPHAPHDVAAARPRRSLLACTALLALLGLVACEATPTAIRALEGTYVLHQVDGVPLPIARVVQSGDTVDIVYGVLRIGDDARYRHQVHYATSAGVSNPTDIGALSRRGTSLRFHSENRPDYEAQLSGRDTLRLHYHFDGTLDRSTPPPVLLFVRGEP